MPSSTFNFSGKVPAGNWGRTWLITLALVAIVLAGLEWQLRRHGMVPMVVDDEALWSYWRQQAHSSGSNVVVFVGSSRAQLDIQTEVWRTMFPAQHPVQLAIDGNGPLLVLEDLAADPDFGGLVICDILDSVMIDERQDPRADERAKRFVDFFHKHWSLQEQADRRLRTMLQSRLVLARGWDLFDLCKRWIRGDKSILNPDYLVTKEDRSRQADYRLTDVEQQRKHWLEDRTKDSTANGERPIQGRWSEGFQRLRQATQRIAARGGKVVYVKFPVSGNLRAWEEQRYPRSQFWDEFAKNIGTPVIHFSDSPALRAFVCAEDSHLDVHEAALFTRALGTELKARALF